MAKGIEPDQDRFMYEVLEQLLPPEQPWAVMSGPMLAAEIMAGKPAFGVVASRQAEAGLLVSSLFGGTSIVTEISGDVVGVSYMGVLKNVYSLGLGMTEALGWEGNARGWYVAMAQRECAGIITAMGGSAESAYGPAGLGDMVATGFSQHSRNRGHGHALVKGEPYPQGSEGFASLDALLGRIGNTLNDRPLLRAIKSSVLQPAQAEHNFNAVLRG
jgi:glycerol-3-phosphate dehydrogenase (NAD(P)+)